MRTLLILLLVSFCQTLPAGWKPGLTGAVKKSVEKLDRKVAEKRSAETNATGQQPDPCASSRIKWCRQGDTYYYSAPAIADDGTVYAASSQHFNFYANYWNQGLTPPSTGYGLVAFTAAGEEKWRVLTGAPGRGGAVVGTDGTIYAVFERMYSDKNDTRADLYAFTSTGSVKWIFSDITTSYRETGNLTPAIADDGTIYVQGSRLWAVNPDGSAKWNVSNGEAYDYTVISSPVIGPDGTIYAVCWPDEQTLCGYSPADGSRLWKGPNIGSYPITASPVISVDSTVYIGAQDDHAAANGRPAGAALFAISTGTVTGTIKWVFSAGTGDIRATPAIGPDGVLYFGTKGSFKFLAVNPDGTQKWVYNFSSDGGAGVEGDVYTSAAIGDDGLIYFSNEAGYIYALNQDGTLNWKLDIKSKAINWSSPAIAADGTMYMGSTYDYFFAVNTGSTGLSPSAQWPKFHANNKNTGKK